MRWIFGLVLLWALQANAGSIYLCRAYAGGTFWAQAHCNQHNALIERIVSVPDNMPFDQQVHIGEQQRSAAAAANASANPPPAIYVQPVADTQAECKALDAQIAAYDAQARQPQAAQTQDWITAQRRKARDRQYAIRCR